MFKLIFVTLIAFFAVLFVYGDGETRRVTAAPTEPATEAAPQENRAAEAAEEAAAEARAQAESESAAQQSAAEVEQTPEQRPRYAGPELRPSPEYANQQPAEDLAEAPTDTLYVTGSSVNFRAGPTTSDNVVGRLSRGQIVTAIGPRTGDWVEIRDGQGRTGFMSAQFLSADQP
ncbi:SH3 domain-containing protein [Paracoccus aerodenitrificans]|uniref:SH3 domain-containing protein n=1 Tax=Paracoccus aerodenitrificans TaxID=3017781 RepID=UPI0022F00420|nr:SH3 domain-containing protein [Paracoccus aerodenitrificans]WBU63142.1 SH3 domain-containing protein [Paracoccus aerodenitrificans]